jgi:uncharacterized protein DUF3617
MIRIAAALSLAVISARPAQAADLPSRKPGLWEVKTSIEGSPRPLTVQQCIDASTDRMLQSSAGPFSPAACPEREVTKSGASISIDSRCTLSGKPASAHADITGSLDSAYTMTVTSEGGGLPAVKMTVESKWLGACAADQQPGDVMMPGGVKINVPELQKSAPAPDVLPPPRN